MSPEQLLASGVADKHADLWGLAACAFVAATGKLPYTATSLGDLVKQVCLNPPPVPSAANPGLPASFDAWFARACASNPADRFQSGYEFARELQGACGIARASMFSHYPTPLPGAELMTPPMGLPAVRTLSNPDAVRKSDPHGARTMRPVFAPGPPEGARRRRASSPRTRRPRRPRRRPQEQDPDAAAPLPNSVAPAVPARAAPAARAQASSIRPAARVSAGRLGDARGLRPHALRHRLPRRRAPLLTPIPLLAAPPAC
jgi:hypothetical protein